jgi:hypothetical protein
MNEQSTEAHIHTNNSIKLVKTFVFYDFGVYNNDFTSIFNIYFYETFSTLN